MSIIAVNPALSCRTAKWRVVGDFCFTASIGINEGRVYVFFVKAILKCLHESGLTMKGSYLLKLKNLFYLHLVCLQAFFSRLLMPVCFKTSGVVSKPTQVAQFQVMSQHLLFCSILLMEKRRKSKRGAKTQSTNL